MSEVNLNDVSEMNDIMALFGEAVELTIRAASLEEAISIASEVTREPPPNPKWWWGFVPSKRRAMKVWHKSEKLLERAPREINIARNDHRKVVEQLREKYGLRYTCSEQPDCITAVLYWIGSGEVFFVGTARRL